MEQFNKPIISSQAFKYERLQINAALYPDIPLTAWTEYDLSPHCLEKTFTRKLLYPISICIDFDSNNCMTSKNPKYDSTVIHTADAFEWACYIPIFHSTMILRAARYHYQFYLRAWETPQRNALYFTLKTNTQDLGNDYFLPNFTWKKTSVVRKKRENQLVYKWTNTEPRRNIYPYEKKHSMLLTEQSQECKSSLITMRLKQ